MKTSESAKIKIKEFEGCVLTAYKCPAGVWTVGYGHTKNVTPGVVISQAVANTFFESDIKVVELQVNSSLPMLTVCQFDAIVSFVYNLGLTKFLTSTLYRKIKANANDPSIATEFGKWKLGGGRVLPGLIKRRDWEAKRYFNKI